MKRWIDATLDVLAGLWEWFRYDFLPSFAMWLLDAFLVMIALHFAHDVDDRVPPLGLVTCAWLLFIVGIFVRYARRER